MISENIRRAGSKAQTTQQNKDLEREAIARQTQEFFRKGGSIESIDPGVSGISIPGGKNYRNYPISGKQSKKQQHRLAVS